jgi:hypothetical protein
VVSRLPLFHRTAHRFPTGGCQCRPHRPPPLVVSTTPLFWQQPHALPTVSCAYPLPRPVVKGKSVFSSPPTSTSTASLLSAQRSATIVEQPGRASAGAMDSSPISTPRCGGRPQGVERATPIAPEKLLPPQKAPRCRTTPPPPSAPPQARRQRQAAPRPSHRAP